MTALARYLSMRKRQVFAPVSDAALNSINNVPASLSQHNDDGTMLAKGSITQHRFYFKQVSSLWHRFHPRVSDDQIETVNTSFTTPCTGHNRNNSWEISDNQNQYFAFPASFTFRRLRSRHGTHAKPTGLDSMRDRLIPFNEVSHTFIRDQQAIGDVILAGGDLSCARLASDEPDNFQNDNLITCSTDFGEQERFCNTGVSELLSSTPEFVISESLPVALIDMVYRTMPNEASASTARCRPVLKLLTEFGLDVQANQTSQNGLSAEKRQANDQMQAKPDTELAMTMQNSEKRRQESKTEKNNFRGSWKFFSKRLTTLLAEIPFKRPVLVNSMFGAFVMAEQLQSVCNVDEITSALTQVFLTPTVSADLPIKKIDSPDGLASSSSRHRLQGWANQASLTDHETDPQVAKFISGLPDTNLDDYCFGSRAIHNFGPLAPREGVKIPNNNSSAVWKFCPASDVELHDEGVTCQHSTVVTDIKQAMTVGKSPGRSSLRSISKGLASSFIANPFKKRTVIKDSMQGFFQTELINYKPVDIITLQDCLTSKVSGKLTTEIESSTGLANLFCKFCLQKHCLHYHHHDNNDDNDNEDRGQDMSHAMAKSTVMLTNTDEQQNVDQPMAQLFNNFPDPNLADYFFGSRAVHEFGPLMINCEFKIPTDGSVMTWNFLPNMTLPIH
ncbi:hypothetical protein V1514DRAFT_384 [Lipomyces japonicus]|uniref:uncharacterized protein n=1 Tax=Lipomyces japonicus TaxID=56871 RepID=UPI0034CF3F97